MFAAAFPWDVAIVALSTLVAGLGAAWWAGRLARTGQTTQWRLEEQRAAAEQILRAWSNLYIELARVAKEASQRTDDPGLWVSPLVDFTEWAAAVERLSLVADHSLVRRAVELDTEMWRHHVHIFRLGDLVNTAWLERTQPLHDARMRFVKTAREVLGSLGEVDNTSGKPPPDDPIWTEAYWKDERERSQRLIAGGPSRSNMLEPKQKPGPDNPKAGSTRS